MSVLRASRRLLSVANRGLKTQNIAYRPITRKNPFSTISLLRNQDQTLKFPENPKNNDQKAAKQQQQQQKGINVDVNGGKTPIGKVEQEKFLIAFTCKKCKNRSSHIMSKQAYTKGTVLIECPGCNSRHLIADHLHIFNDNRITIEDILKAQGESVTKNGDIQFDELPDSIKEKLNQAAQQMKIKHEH